MVKPWTMQTFPKGRPVWIRRKRALAGASMICGICPDGALVFESKGKGMWVTWKELEATCEQVDGRPCGGR